MNVKHSGRDLINRNKAMEIIENALYYFDNSDPKINDSLSDFSKIISKNIMYLSGEKAVVLPAEIGDTVYVITRERGSDKFEYTAETVESIQINSFGMWIITDTGDSYDTLLIGKKIFFSEIEIKVKLEELNLL